VKREVATPVGPTYSMSMNPASAIMRWRSRTRDRATYSIGPGIKAIGHLCGHVFIKNNVGNL
jgi:hypothetical protein